MQRASSALIGRIISSLLSIITLNLSLECILSPINRTMMRGLNPLKLALVTFATIVGVSGSAQLQVTTLADSGPGSLRAAVSLATNGDKVYFDSTLVGEVFLLSPISVSQNIEIASASYKRIKLDGGGTTQLFTVSDPITLTLRELTLQNGSGTSGGAMIIGAGSSVTLDKCVINGCSALAHGGGIYIYNNAELLARNCTFTNCEAGGNGGALCADTASGVTAVGSTFSNNIASGFGGVAFVVDTWNANFSNSTLSGNSALDGSAIYYQIVSGNVFPSYLLRSNTIAYNTPGHAIVMDDPLNFGTALFDYSIFENDSNYKEVGFPSVSSGDYNNSSDGTMVSILNQLNDVHFASALLEPLDGNGGPTQTHALQGASLAIDNGPGAATTDQRGYRRNGPADKGACEYFGIPQDTVIVINEVDSDTPGSDLAEFVELFDGGEGLTCLNGMVLAFLDGATDQVYAVYDLDGYITDRDGYFVVGNAATPNVDLIIPNNTIQDGADAAALYFGNADDYIVGSSVSVMNIIDAIVYDTDDADDAGLLALIDIAEPQVNENGGLLQETHSMQRIPNGQGGKRRTSNYLTIPPTPGVENFCVGSDPGVGDSTGVCENESAVNLMDVLQGTPAPGGTWTDDSSTGQLTDSIFDATGLGGGTYYFTYHLLGGGLCPDDSATVIVTVVSFPNPGTDSTISVCESGTSVNLNNAIGGFPDVGGIWSDDDATGQQIANLFSPANLGGGAYDFSYTISGGGCPDTAGTVTVNVEDQPNAGRDSAVSICETATNYNLFLGLGGTAQGGGSWNDDDVSGGLTGNSFNATGLSGGTYDFTYTITGTLCTDSSATVSVTVVGSLVAGQDSASVLCESVGVVNLNTKIGGFPDGGGTWYDDDGTSQLAGSLLTATGLGTGIYDFTYKQVSAGCTRDSATVTLSISAEVDGGMDSIITICSSESAYNLNIGIGGNPDGGGTWNDDDASGQLIGSVVNATTLGGGTYDFTYTVAGGACPDSSATVTMNVGSAVTAGGVGTLNACEAEAALNLFDGLPSAADTGGIWVDIDLTSQLTDSLLDCSGLGGFDYDFMYVMSADPGCPSDTGWVNVTIVGIPNPGIGGTLTACETNTSINLNPGLTGSPNTGGTWNDDDATGALTGNIVNGSGLGGATYDFTYTVSAVGCPDTSATVALTIEDQGSAGVSNDTTICLNQSVQLGALLGVHTGQGSWTDDDATGRLTDSTFNGVGQAAGTYDFTYTITANAPCMGSAATITVVIEDCTGINESEAPNMAISIAPNPNGGQFTVTIKGRVLEQTQLIIRAIDGRIIWKDQVSKAGDSYQQQVDISSFADGLYYLQILDDKHLISRRIIKQ